ncbi:helix-turn-helix domain-containing protein [Granulicella sibirica]|uniref:Transcriptional regulator, AraC family n=1 Tax=Granulicella sibirica TaxID=2479048 RepID=A0A4Q0T0D8_9BACT|nr:helix-turn-helix domain-containing protein [Granulicella sibirica]RXH56172.1 Transcriptional regulator, AraC family [Granulicella sibirica]
MLRIDTALPHPELTPHIRAYVQRDFRMGREEAIEPVVARLGMMLEFQFRDPYWIPSFSDDSENPCSPVTVIGPISSRRVRLIVRGNVGALAVIFHPAGFHQMFGIPAAPLAERGTEGHGVLGPDVSQLHERLGNVTSFARRVEFLNAFFREHLKQKDRPVFVQSFQPLLKNRYRATVAQVARQTGMSARQFERKSLEYFGLSPIMLSRIARFQRALNLGLSQETSWLKVAHEADYYDQMHMIRDFRVFAGGPPTKALASIESHHLIRF